jgi:hypothetical protein
MRFDASDKWDCPHSARATKLEIKQELNQFLASKDNKHFQEINRVIEIEFEGSILKELLK